MCFSVLGNVIALFQFSLASSEACPVRREGAGQWLGMSTAPGDLWPFLLLLVKCPHQEGESQVA